MSAFLVAEIHINLIVTAAIDLRLVTNLPPTNDEVTITEANAEAFGRMLWAENARSVAYRYPQDDNSELGAEVAGYRFRRYPPLTPHAAAKIIAAYAYQACETPDYDGTPAAHAVAAFAPFLPVYSGVHERPEFARIPWGIDDETAARKCFADQTPPAITATIAKMADFAREGQGRQTRA
jgi:hypothetical protein